MYEANLSINERCVKLLISIGLIGILALAFAVVLLIGIRLKKINEAGIFRIRRCFITAVSTILVYTVFPIAIGTVVYLILFTVFRVKLYKKDALVQRELYLKYAAVGKEYPLVTRFSQVFSFRHDEITDHDLDKDFICHYFDYFCGAIFLPILCFAGVAVFNHSSVLIYGVEYFITATALYVLIGKILYWLGYDNPGSPFYLSPRLAYIPVGFVGAVFYVLAALIFRSTL